jgi:hypothetical protein
MISLFKTDDVWSSRVLRPTFGVVMVPTGLKSC